uniref:PDZ domain-containing protein n=1 Tax=Timema cristinae TaxID=61476 RepID=A0A7R9GRA7_TIMCR|nr:unnamed protein product [Timema cristinae]
MRGEARSAVEEEEVEINRHVALPASSTGPLAGMIAPISGHSLGLQRAQVSHGLREVTICKDSAGRVGLRVQAINKGVFVCLVIKDSPAALAGLRFGDQILQINGTVVAGFTMDQVHSLFRKSPVNGISVVVRDRPFERTVTLHKDSVGHIGFQYKNGKIIGLVKDSSAARNGLLTEHHLLEVNGQNVVGLKDKQITALIEEGGPIITITIIPSFVYDHMVKKMAITLVKGSMDHSIPDVNVELNSIVGSAPNGHLRLECKRCNIIRSRQFLTTLAPIMFWIKLLMWMLPILASCLGGAGAKLYRRESDDPETWTGRWLPERYPSPTISHPDLHDSKHGVQMGIPSAYCDDAKVGDDGQRSRERERGAVKFGLVEIGEETTLGLLILYNLLTVGTTIAPTGGYIPLTGACPLVMEGYYKM